MSITSSFSARPPHVSVRLSAAGGELDLQEGTLLGVWLGDVHDEEVGEHELGQRMGAVARPRASRLVPSRPSQKARLAFRRAR